VAAASSAVVRRRTIALMSLLDFPLTTAHAAREVLREWISSDALRGHCEGVAACMEGHARRLAPSEVERWTIAGLLHDLDYERHPTPAEHPRVGVEFLRSRGVDEEILEAILGHAEHAGTLRRTPMAKVLFAVDELSGFITACARVRPSRFDDLEPRSIRKKLKDKAFAAGVSREDVAKGIAEMTSAFDLDEDAHLAACIAALREAAPRLGLAPAG